MTPKDIITKAGGHAAVCSLIGLKTEYTRDYINGHLRKGKLPAAWFAALEARIGEPLPRECFSFKGNF